jgi:purine nucleosidase
VRDASSLLHAGADPAHNPEEQEAISVLKAHRTLVAIVGGLVAVTKVHIDTDIGGDIDDLCALAMLLRWPDDIEISGITTVAEIGGKRAGYARYVCALEGRGDIPIAAGADVSGDFYRYPPGLHPEERYWPEPAAPAPGPVTEAVQLLKRSIEQGATIVAIGPLTNLYLLDNHHPGILEHARLFLMGGYIYPTRPGFPDWGNEDDYNFQVDVKSAKYVLEHSNPTLITLSVTAETFLRRAYLNELKTSGAPGRLIARQAEAFAIDEKKDIEYGGRCPGLPHDIINFQHDALACAVALGWDDGVEIEEARLVLEEEDGWLTERIDSSGRPARVVTKVDGPRFSEFWLNCVLGK